ncbi:MAG TPA: hypothetical protein VGQ83_32345 [Polyangia bacterium]|jgi:hypothetical protein
MMLPRGVVLLLCVLAPGAARATGRCENTPRRYEPPRLFAATSESFAVGATQAWCEERGDQEVRGVLRFTELRDLKGEVVARLASARGRDAARLTKLVGPFDFVAAGKLAKTLTARGFAPLVPSRAGQGGRCAVRVPQCQGPPPGYFGADDAGDCYPLDQPVVLALDAATRTELGACFAPAGGVSSP